MQAGYSGTPLFKKLGIRPGQRAVLVNTPTYYFSLFEEMPLFKEAGAGQADFIHFFCISSKELYERLPALKARLADDGMIWVSWPKKASKVPTDVTEHVIRNLALDIGLVDVKVCAIDETWSGLKLVIPVKDRNKGIDKAASQT